MCLYKQVVAMQRAAAQQHVEINRLKALLRNGKKTQKGAGKGNEHMSQAHLEMLQASVVLFSLTMSAIGSAFLNTLRSMIRIVCVRVCVCVSECVCL